MLKLIKYLNKSKLAVLTIIILLFIQAQADLALPDYTSKIVNVGISQSGIEEVKLEKISEKTYEELSIIDENNVLKESYKKDDSLYILKKDSEELKQFLIENLLVVKALNTKEILIKLEDTMPFIKGKNIFDILKTMDNNSKENFVSKIKENIKIPSEIKEQAVITVIKEEYESININVGKRQSDYIFKNGALMILIALVSLILSVTVSYLGSKIAAKIGKELRSKVYEKVMTFEAKEFKNFETSSLITRTTNDIQQVQQVSVMILRIVIYAPILGIGGFLKVLNTNADMAWIVGLSLAMMSTIILILFIIVIPKFKMTQKLLDKLNQVSREILTGISVIRAFSNEKNEEKRFDKANKDLTKTNLFINRAMSLMMPTMMFIMNLIAIIIVYNGAYQIDNGTMQIGNMMAFIQYTMQIVMSFLMIAMISIMIPRASVSMSRIEEVLRHKITIKNKENPIKIENHINEVEFKNVSFSYEDAEEETIKDINFIAKKGETIAFVGSTGSGKSTLINLIPRFYDATKGEVLINNINIKDIEIKSLRKKVGYIPQKGFLFSGTIESNIKYGNEKLTKRQIEEVVKTSQSKTFIEEKKDKYETEVSQGGTTVSGGQKQRLSIARAIAINPDLYIFDDSFSALDYKTDKKLREELSKTTKNKITFIVAQRVSTIMNADKIIVLEDGKQVGIGTHDELYKKNKIYKEIVTSQLTKEELAHE